MKQIIIFIFYVFSIFLICSSFILEKKGNWESLIPIIRTTIQKNPIAGCRLQSDCPISIFQEMDITGDGVAEAIVNLGCGGRYVSEMILMQVENGQPKTTLFKYPSGWVGPMVILFGTSERFGCRVKMNSEKKAIYIERWDLDKDGNLNAELGIEVTAYEWNESSKIFECNPQLSSEQRPEFYRELKLEFIGKLIKNPCYIESHWDSIMPEIRKVVRAAFADAETDTQISCCDEGVDITGDGVPEYFVGLGMQGAYTDGLTLIRFENNKPIVALFKSPEGQISPLAFASGASVRNGSKVEMLAELKVIYSAAWGTDDSGKLNDCHVIAYIWNPELKFFEFSLNTTDKIKSDICSKLSKE